MAMSLTYTLRQLKAELQMRTENATLEWLASAEKANGFPRRLPNCSPPKWSKPAVDCWFENWDNRPIISHEIVSTAPAVEHLRNLLEGKYQ